MTAHERHEKPLAWATGAEAIADPPMPSQAKIDAGYLLRRVQRGENVAPPLSEPRPDIGSNCHELRLTADRTGWRVFYHIASDVVVVLGVFGPKKTQRTPERWTRACRKRLRSFEQETQ